MGSVLGHRWRPVMTISAPHLMYIQCWCVGDEYVAHGAVFLQCLILSPVRCYRLMLCYCICGVDSWHLLMKQLQKTLHEQILSEQRSYLPSAAYAHPVPISLIKGTLLNQTSEGGWARCRHATNFRGTRVSPHDRNCLNEELHGKITTGYFKAEVNSVNWARSCFRGRSYFWGKNVLYFILGDIIVGFLCSSMQCWQSMDRGRSSHNSPQLWCQQWEELSKYQYTLMGACHSWKDWQSQGKHNASTELPLMIELK